jgi:hypothetical protein
MPRAKTKKVIEGAKEAFADPRSIGSPEVIADVLTWLADGGTLSAFCRQEGAPSFDTIWRWQKEDRPAGFRNAYLEAREIGTHKMADELKDIVDGGAENVPHAKLRADTRIKILAKLMPDVWGDQMKHQVTISEPIKTIEVEYVPVEAGTDTQASDT